MRTHRRSQAVRTGSRGVGAGVRKPDPDNGSRCPVCGKATTLTTSGHLRRHRDLFGHDCYNRRTA